MAKKTELPCYEVYTVVGGEETVHCTTFVRKIAQRMYYRHCSWGSNPRVRVDGQKLTITEADNLMFGKGA